MYWILTNDGIEYKIDAYEMERDAQGNLFFFGRDPMPPIGLVGLVLLERRMVRAFAAGRWAQVQRLNPPELTVKDPK